MIVPDRSLRGQEVKDWILMQMAFNKVSTTSLPFIAALADVHYDGDRPAAITAAKRYLKLLFDEGLIQREKEGRVLWYSDASPVSVDHQEDTRPAACPFKHSKLPAGYKWCRCKGVTCGEEAG